MIWFVLGVSVLALVVAWWALLVAVGVANQDYRRDRGPDGGRGE